MFRLSRVSAHLDLTGTSPNDHSGGNQQRVTAASPDSPALPSRRLPVVRSSPAAADTTESVDFSRTFMTFRIDSLKKEVLTSGHSRRGDEERLFSARTQPAGRSPIPSGLTGALSLPLLRRSGQQRSDPAGVHR